MMNFFKIFCGSFCKVKKKIIWGVAAVFVLVFLVGMVVTCNHKEVYTLAQKEATCVEDGVEHVVCSKCDAVLETRTLKATGHSFGDYVVTVEPSAGQNGVETRTCKKCLAEESREYVCPHADICVSAENEATCTKDGFVTYTCRCGYAYTEAIGAVGHSYWQTVVAPGCTSAGYVLYKCSVCGDSYKDSEVGALGHHYETQVVAPTTESEGYTSYVCSVCGDSYRDNYVDRLVSFREVNETVYAVKNVNIRKGPGTNYEKVGSLKGGESVVRIGIGSNGWSRVIYNDKERYISSNYLTPEEPHTETVAEEMARRGSVGRLTIPSLGVDVALFASSSQKVCDNQDSACYFRYGVQHVVADHKHQGFAAMKKAVPNKTKAYINWGTWTQAFICVDNFKGHNTGDILCDLDGNDCGHENSRGLLMYTCNENWRNITITYWQPV